jgi:UDP-N-acetylglucosamine 2-epimerase (non-hydrolysing)
MKNRILIVVGTRPNFIKITRFKKVNEMMGHPFDIRIVHTGQHYDDKMAAVFFQQFELEPDFFPEYSGRFSQHTDGGDDDKT